MAHILIVDDDHATRIVLRTILEEAGHEVVVAEEGFDALRCMGRQLPDLVITELYMEGMEGMEFLQRLRQTWPDERVLVMTSRDRVGSRNVLSVARLLGAAGYLDKPLHKRRVVDAVEAILAS